MSRSISLYSFEDADGVEPSFTTQDFREAQRYARENNLKLIDNTFEWADSEVVEDNTGDEYSSDDDEDGDDEDEDESERCKNCGEPVPPGRSNFCTNPECRADAATKWV